MAIIVDPTPNPKRESWIKSVNMNPVVMRSLKNLEFNTRPLALEIAEAQAETFRRIFHQQQIKEIYINQIELFNRHFQMDVVRRAISDFNRFSSHRDSIERAIRFHNSVRNLFPETSASLKIFRELSENHLLATSRTCQDFLNGTLDQLQRTQDGTVKKALHASVYLFEQQLRATGNILHKIYQTPAIGEGLFIPSKLDVPIIQQRELLTAKAIGDDYDESNLIQLSPTAQTERASRRILLLVEECNDTAKVIGLHEIFRPTTRLFGVFRCFPLLLPVDRKSFGDFVDSLYLLFYEGAGSDKLRFLKEHGGVLYVGECDFIWIIKSLRNKWLRHDPDHGEESDIRRSWNQLGETFRQLGLRYVPTTEAEFRYLHRQLLKRGIVFLKKLSKQLKDKPE